MSPATQAQSRVLDAIRKLSRGGKGPSLAEIGGELGIKSQGHLHALLHGMRDRGLITFQDGKARTIRIVGELAGLHERSTEELLTLRTNIEQILIERSAG